MADITDSLLGGGVQPSTPDDQPAAPPPPSTPGVPQDNQLDPILQSLGDLFSTPESKAWAAPAVIKIQQDLNTTRAAEANDQAHDTFINNLQMTKENLQEMVSRDPTKIQLGLDLAHDLTTGLIQGTGVENPDDIHGQIAGHIQQEVARTAIQRMAEIDLQSTAKMLDQYGDYLKPEDIPAIKQYAMSMEGARQADQAAQADQANRAAQWNSGGAAANYALKLLDLGTENVQFPDGFMRNLVRSTGVLPADKIPLVTAFTNLRQMGDVQQSDPHVLTDLISRAASPDRNAPTPDEIMGHVGTSLRYADAAALHNMVRMQTPEGEGIMGALSDVLNRARTTLAPNDDRVGNAAFSRFANWLMPAFRQAGPDSLSPASDNFLFKNATIANWRPTLADAAPLVNPTSRPPLGAIFGRMS